MSRLKLYYRIIKLYILNRFVNLKNISHSFDNIISQEQIENLNIISKSSIPMLDEIIKTFDSNEDKNINILDIGCGLGFSSNYLHSKLPYGNFTLVDISKNMLIKAKDFCNFNGTFVESDMLSYLNTCNDNSFDIIICSYAIGYNSPKEIIKECSRVLKYKGYLGVIDNLKGNFPEIKKVSSKFKINNYKLLYKVPFKLNLFYNDYFFEKVFVDNKFNRLNVISNSNPINFTHTTCLHNFILTSGILPSLSLSFNTDDSDAKLDLINLLNNNNIKVLTHNYIWGAFRNDK